MSLRAARRTDAGVLQILRKFLEDDSFPAFASIVADSVDLGSDLTKQIDLVDSETIAIQQWIIRFQPPGQRQNPHVELRRTENAYDVVEFKDLHHLGSENRLRVQRGFAEAFHVSAAEVAADVALQRISEALGDELVRISETISATHRHYSEARRDIEAQALEHQAELERKYEAKREELERQHAERMEALSQREQEVDAIDARAARRRSRKNLVDQLAEVTRSFNLSADTIRRRYMVRGAFIVLLAVTGLISFYALQDASLILAGPTIELDVIAVYRLARSLLAVAALVVAAVAFLRWENGWLHRLADEELRQRKLALDLQRADWLVEAVQEQYEDKGVPLPEELVVRLSTGLFAPSNPERPHPLLEVLGDSSNFRIQTGIGEASFNRRGVKRVTDHDL